MDGIEKGMSSGYKERNDDTEAGPNPKVPGCCIHLIEIHVCCQVG